MTDDQLFYDSDYWGARIAIDNTQRWTDAGRPRRVSRPIRRQLTAEERLEMEIRREEESNAS